MRSYKFGVNWIAQNDETGETDQGAVADLVSVMLLADLAGKTPEQVAKDVLKARKPVTKKNWLG